MVLLVIYLYLPNNTFGYSGGVVKLRSRLQTHNTTLCGKVHELIISARCVWEKFGLGQSGVVFVCEHEERASEETRAN